MNVQIFLSLSFTDVTFVRAVYERLPRGVARFYEKSFERGEDIIEAMERNLDQSEVFVLFASRSSLSSYAVQFEIEEARYRTIAGKLKRVIVFPLEPGIGYQDFPKWLQKCWAPAVGYTASDIARYLTALLLEPDFGLSIAAPKVVGRGASLDKIERLSALHLQNSGEAPRVYIFAGLTGIGRKTFSSYYLRRAFSSEASLPFGPVFVLSPQAELVDIYRAIRVEINPSISSEQLIADQTAFLDSTMEQQVAEIIRSTQHFSDLGQAVTVVSAAGLFEDAGHPKQWVKPLLNAVPREQIFLLVTNLQFKAEFLEELRTAIQYRVPELSDEDIRTLMIFTAEQLGLKDFQISQSLLAAIGGHADVANAAVKLALQKGTAVLDRDPRQLFNVQQAIIGDVVSRENLTSVERVILDVLGWLPGLGADLLEEIVVRELGIAQADFDNAIESLILACLINVTQYRYAISPAVRKYYRRFNVAEERTLKAMAKVFKTAWQRSTSAGFRDDLFSAFIFMQVLEGSSMPKEFRALLTPGNLHDAVRDAYARGKETDDPKSIRQAIEWGDAAKDMKMSSGVREEILSTVARAQIRLPDYSGAENTIAFMRAANYRSVTFLEGHLLRKRKKYDQAIPKLRYVVEHNRHNRSAVHELALCYRRMRMNKELEGLLKDHGNLVDDSAMFLDFMIGLKIARGDLQSVPDAVRRLRIMDDGQSRADIRWAQYLLKSGQPKESKVFLTGVIEHEGRGNRRVRSQRAISAARAGDTKLAREDLAYIRSLPNTQYQAAGLEMQILMAEGQPGKALDLSKQYSPQEPGDWLLRASILDAVAVMPVTGLSDAAAFRQEASEIRAKWSAEVIYSFEDYEP